MSGPRRAHLPNTVLPRQVRERRAVHAARPSPAHPAGRSLLTLTSKADAGTGVQAVHPDQQPSPLRAPCMDLMAARRYAASGNIRRAEGRRQRGRALGTAWTTTTGRRSATSSAGQWSGW
ncbi:hypothetical protein E4U92_32805 [Streptomyces galbus]|uniref:Uncharacterized protein n=1 Tax=Streptomyces galbus TaxID=33898 RepID=A0A4V6AUU7_STRGB|nr:hypothetical protein E4U92_32805 [Streptomyces galbus]